MGNTFPTVMAALEPCHAAFEDANNGIERASWTVSVEVWDLVLTQSNGEIIRAIDGLHSSFTRRDRECL